MREVELENSRDGVSFPSGEARHAEGSLGGLAAALVRTLSEDVLLIFRESGIVAVQLMFHKLGRTQFAEKQCCSKSI